MAVSFIKIRDKDSVEYCVNPYSITHFHAYKENDIVYYRCYLGNSSIDIPKDQFVRLILPHLNTTG